MKPSEWVDYAGACHVHSVYSDGSGEMSEIISEAHQAELDFLIMTDHNTLEPLFDGWQGWHDRVLVVVGVETSPYRVGHCIGLDVHRQRNYRWMEPAECLDEINAQGGVAFIAHPMGKRKLLFSVHLEKWTDWDRDDFVGIELWSYMHDWIEDLTPLNLAWYYLKPHLRIKGPDRELIRIWDDLTRRRKVVGISGLDAHARHIVARLWPVFPYHFLFRTVRTHVLCEPFEHDAESDVEKVIRAHREGRCYVAYDGLADARGFRFVARAGDEERIMGQTLHAKAEQPVRFEAETSWDASIRLLRHGEVVAESDGKTLDAEVAGHGAYRVEAHLGREPWVFSNPIYVTERGEYGQETP